MEGGHNKYSKASSDEVDSPEQEQEQVNDDAASGRFYECIFCKRGFSTAQALGGHMNIHRKDRARMRQNPVPTASRKAEEDSMSYGYHHHSYSGHQSSYPPVSESVRNLPIYFPASSSGAREMRLYSDDDVVSRKPRELSLFGEELKLGLGMHADGLHVENREKREEDDELDLELRLGHEP